MSSDLDILMVCLVVLLGVFTRKGSRLAFFIGMALYCLDGLVCFRLNDTYTLGFHLLATFWLLLGSNVLVVSKKR